jgi:transposase
MAGKSPLSVTEQQRVALAVLAGSRDRGEAGRARAVLLTLVRWTSPRTMRGGVEVLRASVAPGPTAVKSEAALRVVTPLLEEPVADRRNWTIPRWRAEIETREGVRISRSQLSKALRKKVPLAAATTYAEGTPARGRTGRAAAATAQTTGRSRRHRSALRRRKRGVDALLARARMGQGGGGPVCAGTGPGQEGRHDGLARSCHSQLIVHTSSTNRSSDFVARLEQLDRLYGPKPGQPTKRVVLVEDNGPIHTSKLSLAALAARAHWLTVEWLPPKYAPELNDIEVVWHDLKAHYLAHQTLGETDAGDPPSRGRAEYRAPGASVGQATNLC